MLKSQALRAFTLVEILVVIAIISILAGILFPVFSRVREQGRIASCKSNLRQIGLAMQQYADDNGRYPYWLDEKPPWNRPSGSEGELPDIPGWASRIQPYLGSLQILRCPSMSKAVGVKDNVTEMDASEQHIGVRYTDYAFNGYASGLATNQVKHPSNFVLAIDTLAPFGWTSSSSTHGFKQDNSPARHLGQYNHLFADGHVKLISIERSQGICEPLILAPNATYTFCNG